MVLSHVTLKFMIMIKFFLIKSVIVDRIRIVTVSPVYLYGTGRCMFVCGNRRIPIHVLATEKELSEMEMKHLS